MTMFPPLLDLTIMISFSHPAVRRMLTLISTPGMSARSRWSSLHFASYNWRTPSHTLILQDTKTDCISKRLVSKISEISQPGVSVCVEMERWRDPQCLTTRPCMTVLTEWLSDSATAQDLLSTRLINTVSPPEMWSTNTGTTPRPPTCQELSSPPSSWLSPCPVSLLHLATARSDYFFLIINYH